MKLTQNKKLKPGMTLIELTVVIIVLLTLISVLFFAGTAYIKASNRTACLTNQATFQKSMRGYATLNQLEAGVSTTVVDWSVLQTEGFIGDYVAMTCPTEKTAYTPGTLNPATGTQVASCEDPTYGVGADNATPGDGENHAPKDLSNW